jgi:uncharacterized protein YciI
MLFAFINWDDEDAAQLRAELRPVHREYLRAAEDRIAFAGPLLDDDAETVRGSLLVLDFPDREQAEAWLRDEPYTKAGLYGQVNVRPFNNLWPQRAGRPVLDDMGATAG